MRVETQRPPQRSGVSALHPLTHRAGEPAVAGWHTPVGSAHTVAQSPQWAALVRSASHPSTGSAEQCPRPATHAPVSTQAPATQRALAGSTPGSAVQSRVQLPQWRGSVSVFTQSAPQRVWAHASPATSAGPVSLGASADTTSASVSATSRGTSGTGVSRGTSIAATSRGRSAGTSRCAAASGVGVGSAAQPTTSVRAARAAQERTISIAR